MRRSFLLLASLLVTAQIFGQDVKTDYADGEFFLAMEDYEEALYTFTKVYNAGYQDNANINYRIGICLLQIQDRKTESIPYLEKAVASVSEKYREGQLKETNAPPDAHLYLGNAYRINIEFEKACEQYRLFDEYVGEDNSIQSVYAAQQITSCSNAVVAMNEPVDFNIGNLGQVNYTHEEVYNMVVSHDLKTMAYMGKNPFYRGIYVSRKENGLWSRPLGINPSVASDGNMDVVGLSSDGNKMLLAVSDQFASNIYMAEYSDDRWQNAISLGKPINSRYYESHAVFGPDANSIYFTSNRNDGIGAMDIYRSDLQEDGTWGEPVNLGEGVNTQLNEETPFVSPDGKRLYFSSQGFNSIGGFDIYYSELQADGTWGTAVNLGYPLNTTDDDFTISPTGMKEEGIKFIFANAEASQYPVFKFELIDRETSPVALAFDPPAEELASGETTAEEVSPEEGTPEEGTPEEGTPEEGTPEEVSPEEVTPETGKPEHYMVKPVFFGFDQYKLTDAAKKNLDHLAGLMKRFPSLNLEVSGHTDAVGSFEYNKKLSERRALAVKKYLLSKDVAAGRISAVGKSESEHVAANRTRDNKDAPDGRKLNRRSQFKLTVSEEVIVEMEEIQVPDHLKL